MANTTSTVNINKKLKKKDNKFVFWGIQIILLTSYFVYSGIHFVPNRYVGVVFRFGALQEGLLWEPGLHWSIPLMDKVEYVQTSMQTDEVVDIPCGTKGGTIITFDKIEVVNILKKESVLSTVKQFGVHYDQPHIFQKIHHEINQFCSSHSLNEIVIDKFSSVDDRLQEALQEGCDEFVPGLKIVSVRISKPRVPETISVHYAEMEAEKARLRVAEQQGKVAQMEAENEKKKAEIEAERVSSVSKIEMNRKVLEKEKQREIASIENAMWLEKQEAEANAAFYTATKQAESNSLLLTDQFIESKFYDSLSSIDRIYFGPSIPQFMMDSKKDNSSDDAAAAAAAAAAVNSSIKKESKIKSSK